MSYPAVHWFEGMFLRPQHFQAAGRHGQETLTNSLQSCLGYLYGLRSIKIQEDALGAYFFQLNGVRALLRDGSLIDLDGEVLRTSLREAFAKQPSVTVYLAVAQHVLGRANVSDVADPTIRYVTMPLSSPDENSGGQDTELIFRRPNVRLMLSTDNLEGYDFIPIAKLKRVGNEESVPEIDTDYIPPLLAFDGWEPLAMGIVRSLFDLFGQRMEVLSARAADRRLTLSSQNPGDLDDLWMLGQVNQGYAILKSLTFARGIHPLSIYIELCRLVGLLSVFDSTRRVDEDLPAYDHDDLGYIFGWLYKKLLLLLGSNKKLEYEQRFFVGTERGMQVTLDPKWLHPGWKWYVGVHGENIPEEMCKEIVRPGVLDWKMGTVEQVDILFRLRMPDVKADVELRQIPRALPVQRGWVYYEVRRDGPAWADVLDKKTLGMRFNTGVIANLDRLVGQRQLEVIYREKRAVLEFALFAVPDANI